MPTPRIVILLDRLGSADTETSRQALQELDGLGEVTAGEAEDLLHAALRPWPERPFGIGDTACDLVAVAGRALVDASVAAVVAEVFADLPSDRARAEALRVLAASEEPTATDVLVELLRTRASELPDLARLSWRGVPAQASRVVSVLLELDPRHDALHTVLACAAIGAVDADVLTPYGGRLAAYAESVRALVEPFQTRPELWWDDGDYFAAHQAYGIVADLLGYVAGPAARRELEQATSLRDPRLLLYVGVSLVRHGAVPQETLEHVASNPVTRGALFSSLAALGRTDVFPRTYLTQAALAEAVLASWLTWPGELGRPAESIELAEVVAVSDDADAFVFRFSDEEGTCYAGVSGPFRRGAQPTIDALGSPFSDFEPWDLAEPAGHAARIAAVLAEWIGDDAPYG